MANQAQSNPSVDTATTRTWTWTNDISQNSRRQSDLKFDSPLTLRSDGTGHFSAHVDNNDTFVLHLILSMSNGTTMRLPNALGGPSERFEIRSSNRDFEFGWRHAEVLFSITAITIVQGP